MFLSAEAGFLSAEVSFLSAEVGCMVVEVLFSHPELSFSVAEASFSSGKAYFLENDENSAPRHAGKCSLIFTGLLMLVKKLFQLCFIAIKGDSNVFVRYQVAFFLLAPL